MKLGSSTGFTLVELMIALVLGLLLIGACLSTFQSNSNTYSATEAIGRLQEGERTAFEMMSRDIREAGGLACDGRVPLYSVLNGPSERWYSDFRARIKGYGQNTPFAEESFGSGESRRIPGTEAIELKSAVTGSAPITQHSPFTAQMMIGAGDHRFRTGEIVVACDFSHAAIFQVTGVETSAMQAVSHAIGGGIPGNCSSRLGWSSVQNCGEVGALHAFGCYLGRWESGDCMDREPPIGSVDRWPAMLAPVKATRWFLAMNAEGRRSLYRASLRTQDGAPGSYVDEVLPDVSELSFSYLRRGSNNYVAAESLTSDDWLKNDITAVRVELTVSSPHKVVGSVPGRQLAHVVAVRTNE